VKESSYAAGLPPIARPFAVIEFAAGDVQLAKVYLLATGINKFLNGLTSRKNPLRMLKKPWT